MLCICGFFSVVFNVYGPRAVADDAERIEFKHRFYDVLEVSVLVSECNDEVPSGFIGLIVSSFYCREDGSVFYVRGEG